MKKKIFSVLFALVLVVSFSLIPTVASADSPPVIDGVIEADEWGEPFGTYELTHVTTFTASLYITSDDEYLYVAAKCVDGDFSGPQGMGLANGFNIHIDADNNDGMPDNSDITIIVSDDGLCIPCDPSEQGWDCGTYYTYTASEAGILMAWNGTYTTGDGQVEVAVPLSLIDVAPGDTIGLLFQPFSNVKVPPSSPDAAHPDWPETYTDFTLEANTAVGLTGKIPQITAISVSPTDIDFGTVYPGDTVSGDDTIVVENIGTVAVVVDALLNPRAGTVFNYLQLNGAYSPSYNGYWNNIIKSLLPSKSAPFTSQLVVPPTYSAGGTETATLIFEATAK